MTNKELDLPTSTAAHLAKAAQQGLTPKIGNEGKLVDYLTSVLEAGRIAATNDVFTGLDMPDDTIQLEGGNFTSTAHFPSELPLGAPVKGRAAVIRAQARIGKGVPVQVLLPHSGFWLTVLPPTEAELLDLWRTISASKIALGRYTYGAIFSATSIVTTRQIIDFCLSKVETSNLSSEGFDGDYKSVISLLDLPFLLNGLGIAMYPKGVNYAQACVYDPSACSHVTEGVLMPASCAHYNTQKIPEAFRSIIAQTGLNQVTLAVLQLYQQAVAGISMRTVIDETGIETDIYLKAPNLKQALLAGERWIQEVHDSVSEALALETPQSEEEWSERNNLMLLTAKSSFLRQYEAFVVKIDSREAGVADDPESIKDVMEILTSSDKIRTDFIKEVEAYIKQMTVAVIGIPSYTCPACGKTCEVTHQGIIGLNPIRLFFKYLIGKVDQVLQRSLTPTSA